MYPSSATSPRYNAVRNDDFEARRVPRVSSEDDIDDANAFLWNANSYSSNHQDEMVSDSSLAREDISHVLVENDLRERHAAMGGLRPALGISGQMSTGSNDSADGLRSKSAAISQVIALSRKDGPVDLPRWQPFWLRPPVLITFGVLFACLAVSMIAIAVYSRSNDGLSNAHENMAYVWRFGPTALVTLVAVYWARIELQVLRYTPWILIQRGDGALGDDYNLDYTDMIPPVVLYRSLTRKHFMAFVAVATTVLLKVQIVLSSSMFQSVIIQNIHDTDVLVTSSFYNPWSGVDEIDMPNARPEVYAHRVATEQFDMDLPFGVSTEYAYQTFSSLNSNGTESRPEPQRPITVTVEGLFMEAQCLLLEDYTVNSKQGSPIIDFKFADCEKAITMSPYSQPFYNDFKGQKESIWQIGYLNSTLGLGEEEKPCAALPQQNPQFLYFATVLSPSPQNVSRAQVDTLAAVLCSSQAWISTVEVVDDGILPNMTQPAEPADKSTLDLDPWKLLSLIDEVDEAISMNYNETAGPINWFYKSTNKRLNATDESVYQSQILKEAVQGLIKYYTPMLSHYELRHESREKVTGTRTEQVARLQANLGVCVAMAVMFVVSALFAIYTLLQSRKPCNYYYYRDPATMMGSIIHTHSRGGPQGRTSIEPSLESSRDETRGCEKAAWSQENHSPMVLQLWLRILFVLFALGLIIGLVLMLQRSRASDGLGTVSDGGHWPLLWQSLPALLMLLVSLYSSCSDIAIRSLILLSDVSSQPHYSAELDVSLLDMLGFRALYYSIKHAIPAVTLSQCLAALSGLLPAIGSVLLIQETVPSVTDINVPEQSRFGNQKLTADNIETYVETLDTLGQLNLIRDMSNFTNPRHTYFDLVFPSFELDDQNWGPGASAKVSISAAKLSPRCEPVPDDEYELREPKDRGFFDIGITQWFDCPDGTQHNGSWSVQVTGMTERDSSYFGRTISSPHNPGDAYRSCDSVYPNRTSPPWYVETYVWGEFSAARWELERMALWRCNYSWVNVPTEMTVVWSDGDMLIDPGNPPVPGPSSSIQPWTPPFGIPAFHNRMLESDLGEFFNVFPDPLHREDDQWGISGQFMAILEPYGPMSPEDLGDPEKDDEVLETLHSDLAFVAAQLANVEQRSDIKNALDSNSLTRRNQELPRTINVTVTDNSRQRVVQNSTVTYILVAILSVVALVHTWALLSDIWRRSSSPCTRRSWLLDMTMRGVAPPGFSSLAMIDALLEGSNVFNILPDDASLMPSTELHRYLSGKQFHIGWFSNSETGSDIFTLGVLDEGHLVFKGEKKDFEKQGAQDVVQVRH